MGLIIGLALAALAKGAYIAVWSVVESRAERRMKTVEQDDDDGTADRVWRFVA